MAARFKLGSYDTIEGDPLGRSIIGYFPRMTEDEAWEAGRGVWKMDKEKVARQRFALIVGQGLVRAVAEITGYTEHNTPNGARIALEGSLLAAGHPVRDAYLGQPDPVVNGSQNPVGYCSLPEEQPYLERPCACGCGELTDRDFLPGHDVRAIQRRVRDYFGGSPLKLIEFIDKHFPLPVVTRHTTPISETNKAEVHGERSPTPRSR
ncbi:hypothetical protein [Actinoplanes sp. NPDC089786]|uniref:hypothetical protein n=1 Tax=Actinoplanes sp. NPDC089786 TaxID=3155185 RepID=UPI00342667AC